MITLPFSCKEAWIVLKLSGLGLIITSIIYGILFDDAFTLIMGSIILGSLAYGCVLWYYSEIGRFFSRNIRCKCDE